MIKLTEKEIQEKKEMYYSLIESRDIVKDALKLLGQWCDLYIFSNNENDKDTLKGLELEEKSQRTQLDNIEKAMKNIRASVSKEELKRWKIESQNRKGLPEAI